MELNHHIELETHFLLCFHSIKNYTFSFLNALMKSLKNIMHVWVYKGGTDFFPGSIAVATLITDD